MTIADETRGRLLERRHVEAQEFEAAAALSNLTVRALAAETERDRLGVLLGRVREELQRAEKAQDRLGNRLVKVEGERDSIRGELLLCEHKTQRCTELLRVVVANEYSRSVLGPNLLAAILEETQS